MCIKREETELTYQKTDEVITDIQTCLRRKKINEKKIKYSLIEVLLERKCQTPEVYTNMSKKKANKWKEN